MPKILFITRELISGDLCCKLKNEGCDVRFFIKDHRQRKCLDGFITKTNNWKRDLKWVGKDGLIIFDDVGYGLEQDKLRKAGYLVFGGGSLGERLERDRIFGQKILKKYGVIKKNFTTLTCTVPEAIKHIESKKGMWVVKQNDHDTAVTYVGMLKDSSDTIGVLNQLLIHDKSNVLVSLQKKVTGVEIAIGRFFNGTEWCGPSVINFEHKHLCDGDIGPLGGETGTLMWFENNEKNKLFQRTLAKIAPYLKKIQYRGFIDINCIVNKDTLYPLEFTTRFGSSTIQTQCEIQDSKWSTFLSSIAQGKYIEPKYSKGYAINVGLTVSPFPYRTHDVNLIDENLGVFFSKSVNSEDFTHIHFEGVSVERSQKGTYYFTTGSLGYVLYVTGMGPSVQSARRKVYDLISKIHIPRVMYRTDIGNRFIKKDREILEHWGWI